MRVCLSQRHGHIICNVCHLRLINCPRCCIPLGKTRSLIAESIIESFFIPCPFAKHGCQARFQPIQVDNHKEWCEFREINCPIGNCKEKMSLNCGRPHLQAAHQDDVIIAPGDEGKFIGRFNSLSGASLRNIYVRYKEFQFITMSRKQGDFWHLWTYCVAPHPSESGWLYQIELQCHSSELLSCTRKVVSNEKSVDDVMNDRDGLIIPDQFAQEVKTLEVKIARISASKLMQERLASIASILQPPIVMQKLKWF